VQTRALCLKSLKSGAPSAKMTKSGALSAKMTKRADLGLKTLFWKNWCTLLKIPKKWCAQCEKNNLLISG